MVSKRQKKANIGNWLIYRIRGMNTVLCSRNQEVLAWMLPESEHKRIIIAAIAVRNLVDALTYKRIKR